MTICREHLSIDKSSRTATVLNAEACRLAGVPVDMSPGDLYLAILAQRVPAVTRENFAGFVVRSSAGSAAVGILEKFVGLWTAVTGPRCTDDQFESRLSICRVCEFRRVDGEKEYCGACGCPQWRLSELSTKLRFSNLSCPLTPPKWGPV